MKKPTSLRPAEGKLGVLLPGMGAVATTTIAGVMLARRGLGAPIGSLTQLGTIRLGKRTDNRVPKITDFVPLAGLDNLEFGGWDIFPDDAYEAAEHAARARAPSTSTAVKDELAAIRPMPGVFYPDYVKRLHGTHIKSGAPPRPTWSSRCATTSAPSRGTAAATAPSRSGAARPEVYIPPGAVHQSIKAFEARPRADDARDLQRADLRLGLHQGGRPLRQRRAQPLRRLPRRVGSRARALRPHRRQGLQDRPDADEDRSSPRASRRAMLGLRGWYSHQHPRQPRRRGARRSRERSTRRRSPSSACSSTSSQPDLYPELYGDIVHKVRIDYYPPRGDAKEGWDNIDLFGWLGYPMQMKINFLCRDSILAAPARARPRALPRPRAARGLPRDPGVAQLLLQEPDDRARPLPRARSLHPAR